MKMRSPTPQVRIWRPAFTSAKSKGRRTIFASQHLARLRQEGLVTTRREAQSVFYKIADETAEQIVQILYERYCKP